MYERCFGSYRETKNSSRYAKLLNEQYNWELFVFAIRPSINYNSDRVINVSDAMSSLKKNPAVSCSICTQIPDFLEQELLFLTDLSCWDKRSDILCCIVTYNWKREKKYTEILFVEKNSYQLNKTQTCITKNIYFPSGYQLILTLVPWFSCKHIVNTLYIPCSQNYYSCYIHFYYCRLTLFNFNLSFYLFLRVS